MNELASHTFTTNQGCGRQGMRVSLVGERTNRGTASALVCSRRTESDSWLYTRSNKTTNRTMRVNLMQLIRDTLPRSRSIATKSKGATERCFIEGKLLEIELSLT